MSAKPSVGSGREWGEYKQVSTLVEAAALPPEAAEKVQGLSGGPRNFLHSCS